MKIFCNYYIGELKMLENKLNKLFIILILVIVFLNWNLDFIPALEKNYESFFISKKIYLFFISIYPYIEKIIKILFYGFIIAYIFFNIIIFFLKKRYPKQLNLVIIFYFIFIIIFFLQIKHLTFSRVLLFFNITSLLFFTRYLDSTQEKIYKNKFIISLIFINLIFQFFILQYNGRKTLSWLDPNFSSYFLFLFYIIVDNSFKDRKYKILNLIIIIAGFFISSRSFFLSIVIYIIFKNEKISKILEKVLIKLKINSSIVLLIISTIITIIFAQLYIKNMKPNYSYKQSISRLVTFNDKSNFNRFKVLIEFKNNLIKNDKLRERGLTSKEYLKISENFPHNGVAELIRKFGLYLGIISSLIIFKSIFYKLNYKNIAFFISLLIYQTFLGIPFEGAPLLLLAYINSIIVDFNE